MNEDQKKVITGIILLLICVAFFLVYLGGLPVSNKNDVLEIERRTVEFDNLLNREDFEEAYTYMSSSYRQSRTYSEFLKDKHFFAGLGRDKKVKVRGNRGRIFLGYVQFMFWAGREYELIKENGEWYFTSEVNYYLD